MKTQRVLVNSRYRERAQKTCKYCQSTFFVQPSKVDRYRMCPKCRVERYRPPITLICQYCGNSSTRKGYDTRAKYCSTACKWQAMRGQPSGRRVLPDRLCLECGQLFRPTQARAIYCSMECYRNSQRRAKPQYECLQCGKSFYNDTRRKTPQFCSRECKNLYIRGPRHPLWVEIRPERDYGAGWSDLAEAIRQRDGYRCQRCGAKQGDRQLDVHHVLPYRITKNNHPDNLITLCAACHKIVETVANQLTPQS